jgi:hypothetical protein
MKNYSKIMKWGNKEIKVYIVSDGDDSRDENWWGCAALVSEDDLEPIQE